MTCVCRGEYVGSAGRRIDKSLVSDSLNENARLLCALVFAAFLISPIAIAETVAEAQPSDAQRSNVLFIAVDDLNSCLAAMNGETTVATPHINALADRGVLFTNAHCAAPACNPSRTSVMTGLAPSSSGVYYNWQDWRENQILKDRITLPQLFKNNGYETRGGGKLYHAASLSQQGYTGLLDPRPWDGYFPSKDRQMPQEVLPDAVPTNGNKKFYGGRFDWAELEIDSSEMADAKVVAWAEQQLTRKHDKPLFLGVGIYRPHIPWYTPKSYFEKHPLSEVTLPEVVENDLGDVPESGQAMARRHWHQWMVENNKWHEAVRAYNASVTFADDMVGRLLAALDSGPLADSTIVVLWTDHGYHLGQKEHWEKFALWEQTTRVPLIIAAPGVSKSAETSDQAVSLLDLFPTLAELCGIPVSEDLDGISLVPLLRDPGMQTGRAVVCTQGINNHAVRSKSWRYIQYADGSEELYDQNSDPKNFHNLAGDKRHAAMKDELQAWVPQQDAELHPTRDFRKRARK